ncbi:MAG: PAS domain-containing protein [Chloroflexota bacterium]
MIGYEDHEISNRFAEYEDRIHPEDHDRMMQAVNDYLEGRSATYEHEFRTAT